MSGNCFRINPKGQLRGKGGDYGKLRLMFFADLNDYRFRILFLFPFFKRNALRTVHDLPLCMVCR